MTKAMTHSAKTRPPALSLLDAVPLRNAAVQAQEQDDVLLLTVPRRRRWWMRPPLSWWLKFRTHRQVSLDALGRDVWNACSGAKTVEQIIEAFAQDHHLRFHEARLSVTTFLRMLVERNLVVLEMPRLGTAVSK